MLGRVDVLAGNSSKLFCISLHINLQDGVKTLRSWINPKEKNESHVVKMVKNSF
jgi:hypothetical protein